MLTFSSSVNPFIFWLLPLWLLSCYTDPVERDMLPLDIWNDQLYEQVTTIQGQLLNYELSETDAPLGRVIYNHLLENEQVMHSFEISDSGHFEVRFPLMRPQEVMIELPKIFVEIYAAPGKTTAFEADHRAFREQAKQAEKIQFLSEKPLYFSGELQHINTPWISLQPKLRRLHSFYDDQPARDSLSPADYKTWRMAKMQDQLDVVDDFTRGNKPHSDFTTFISHRIRYHAYEDLIRYTWLRPENRGRIDTIVSVLVRSLHGGDGTL